MTWRGLHLSARGCDWAALQEVLIEHEYAALTPYLTRKPSAVVLDLGANIGTFALFTFSVAPSAVVHSYEASATTHALLDSTRAHNPRCHWDVHHAAAWLEDGAVSFTTSEASTAGRIMTEGKETVPAVSLATILARSGGSIDVAKIDIEGAEEALLVDRPAELQRIGTLVVELHPGRCDTGRVVKALTDSYGALYCIPGRRSSKPLILATRDAELPALPRYVGD